MLICEAVLSSTMLQVLIEEEENVLRGKWLLEHLHRSDVLFVLLFSSNLNPTLDGYSIMVCNYRGS